MTVGRSKQNGFALQVSLFARSFFLQSVWNPRGMQNVGLCFALLPLAQTLSEPERRTFMKRHLSFFNTNPTMASYVIGAVAKAEAQGRGALVSDDIKLTMGGPLGMAGDSLMWGAVRPVAGLIAALVAIYALYGGSWSVLSAPLALLLIYNVPHLYLRGRGIRVGSRLGAAGAREVTGPGFKRAVIIARGLLAFTAGVVLAQVVARSPATTPVSLALVVLVLVLASLAVRLRISATVVGLVGGLAWLALVVFGGNGG